MTTTENLVELTQDELVKVERLWDVWKRARDLSNERCKEVSRAVASISAHWNERLLCVQIALSANMIGLHVTGQPVVRSWLALRAAPIMQGIRDGWKNGELERFGLGNQSATERYFPDLFATMVQSQVILALSFRRDRYGMLCQMAAGRELLHDTRLSRLVEDASVFLLDAYLQGERDVEKEMQP